jgi:hypothetical protein
MVTVATIMYKIKLMYGLLRIDRARYWGWSLDGLADASIGLRVGVGSGGY